MDKINGLQL